MYLVLPSHSFFHHLVTDHGLDGLAARSLVARWVHVRGPVIKISRLTNPLAL